MDMNQAEIYALLNSKDPMVEAMVDAMLLKFRTYGEFETWYLNLNERTDEKETDQSRTEGV